MRLALDIGRVSAAAWDMPDGVVRSEARDLGRPGDVASHLRALEMWLDSLVAAYRPQRVYIERHTGRGAGSRTLDAYTAVARFVAARHNVQCCCTVAAISARKLALGRGIADKTQAAALAARVLDLPENLGADEIDARILLAAIPRHLAALRAKADMARLRRNAAARAARQARKSRSVWPGTNPVTA